MLDFLFKDKNGEIQTLNDLIILNTTKLQLAMAAKEKAIGMIANAIAKSEILLIGSDGRRYDDSYFRLNVRPNDNETGTDFWARVIKKTLRTGICYVCRISNKYYIVDSFDESNEVLKPRKYSNITVSYGGTSVSINKKISSDDMLIFRWTSHKQTVLYEKVNKLLDDTASAMLTKAKMESTPKYKLKMDTMINIRRKKDDGTDEVVSKDKYIAELKEKLENELIIPESKGLELTEFSTVNTIKSGDIVKIQNQIEAETAKAFDIPQTVFQGTITEKSDAANEFITYAVGPIAEMMNDTFNAKLVGTDDYIKGERIMVFLGRFKHRDFLDTATKQSTLRGVGWNFDELRLAVGYEALNTDFSQARALTKNFAEDGTQLEIEGGEKNE